MGVNNLCDALTREGLFTEAAFDIHQNFLVCWVCLVKNVLECRVRCAETVAEMLGKDPATVLLSRQERMYHGRGRTTHKHRQHPACSHEEAEEPLH